jgi:hypothetical protein
MSSRVQSRTKGGVVEINSTQVFVRASSNSLADWMKARGGDWRTARHLNTAVVRDAHSM